MKQVTAWFPPAIKPIREGVYQVADADQLNVPAHGFQYWNGRFWGAYNHTPAAAHAERKFRSQYQSHHWRGLAAAQGEKK